MCKKCEEIYPLEDEMARHFHKEMTEYAQAHNLDIVSIENVLKILLNSLTPLVDMVFIQNAIKGLANGGNAPQHNREEKPVSIENVKDDDFNKMITEI